MAGRGTFVGRAGELAALLDVLSAARSGHAGVGVVGGDPGIGKTRLLAEFGRVAAARGWSVVSVQAPAVGVAPAFWPWRQVVRLWPAAGLREELARGGSWLARADAEPSTSLPSPEARFVAFERFGLALARAAGDGTVLRFDDVHRFDPDSLSLLVSVVSQVRECRLAIVGAFRARELRARPSGAELCARVGRHPHGVSITLGGWSSSEVEAGLRAQLGRRAEPAVLAAVCARTGGNPLFVHEIGRLLGAGLAPDALLPDVIRDAVREHLDGLSPACRRTLTVAAVLGREIDPSVLATVSDTDPALVLSHLDEALRAGAVTAVTRRTGPRFGFAHDLFGETLLADLPAAERARGHLRVATALELAGGARPVEIARHRLAALPLGDRAAASRAAFTAGREALAELAYENAAELFDSALDTAPPDMDSARRCELLIEAGRTRFIRRDSSGAVEHCAAAAELALRTGDAESLGRACLALPEFPDPRWTLRVSTWCEQALAGLAEGETSMRAQLLAQQAIAYLFAGGPDQVAATSAAALAMARRVGDDDALRIALRARQLARADPAGHAERLVLGAEMLALGRRRADPEAEFWGHVWRFDALMQTGHIDHAMAEIDRADPIATRLGRPLARWHVLRSRVAVAIGQGRFTEAQRLVRLELDHTPDGLTARAPYWSALLIARLTGDARNVPPDPLPADYDHPIAVMGDLMHLAPYHLALGRTAEAAALLRAVPGVDSARVPPFVRMPVDAMRCTVAAAIGDTDAAEAAYHALLPHADLHVVAGAGVSITYGSAHLPLGIAAAAIGRTDTAIDHFRAAVAANDVAGLHPFAATARHELAAALRSRGEPGDAPEAREHARRAAALAERLGMAPLLTRARELADQLAQRPAWHALTARQREIASLVARGRSNRQIASELHISRRTAENHVRNIMAALGAANRVQVATWMSQGTGELPPR
ncbi:ATP-binding protein [Pseudonocardia acaciae]|uniref:ATP-binding protein n=1 Tax=Pseudonocardia acaciae TaxID=551276 RepID=UPI00048C4BB3|nr:LuxR family transcriptional regulator [Pseudonocardia acaciae]